MKPGAKTKELSADDILIRRRMRRQISTVVESTLPDDVKLLSCLNIANIYTALTGDEELTPPVIVSERAKMASSVQRLVEKAKAVVADKAKGTINFLDGL